MRKSMICAVLTAVVTGAVTAFAVVAFTSLAAIGLGQAVSLSRQADTAYRVPDPVLPFNAKITSVDIPVPGGGVRSGGCSGALIRPEWIITAGHCFHDVDGTRREGKPTHTVTVTVGKLTDADPGGHSAMVVDVRQSPVNDIAVARLSAPAADLTPLTLAGKPPAVGLQLHFAGWGALSAAGTTPSDFLKRGRFAVLEIADATLAAESVVPRTVKNSPCPIDSGAPFFTSADDRTGVLVAVESTGPPCPQPGRETISRVDVVADWIRQQTEGR